MTTENVRHRVRHPSPNTVPSGSPSTTPDSSVWADDDCWHDNIYAAYGAFGPSPVLPHENQTDYNRLVFHWEHAILPQDLVERRWTREIVDLSWRANQAQSASTAYRRLKRVDAATAVMRTAYGPGYYDDKEDLDNPNGVNARGALLHGNEESRGKYYDAMARLELPAHAIDELAYVQGLPTFDHLQRIADTANKRRDSLLREIERRRRDIAKRLRDEASADERSANATLKLVAGGAR